MNTPTLIDGKAELVPAGRESDWKALRDQLDRTAHAMGSGVLHVVVSGLMMEDLKATCKHGEFGPALHRNCYPDLSWEEFQKSPWHNAYRWMATAKAACGVLQIYHDDKFGRKRLAEVLTADVLDLPKEAQEIQARFADLCAGASQKQLQLAWKGEPAKAHTPAKPVNPEEQLKAELEQAKALADDAITAIALLVDDPEMLAKVKAAKRAELMAWGTKLNKAVRALKNKKAKHS